MDGIIPTERIINRILVVRNQKVILDRDLAILYNVETRTLNTDFHKSFNRHSETD